MELATFEGDQHEFTRARAGDEKLAVRFFAKATQDGEQTALQGRPIFKEVDYIQIVLPGDRTNTVVRPVSAVDAERFRLQFEHWKRTKEEQMLQGTPLEAWGIMNLAQIEEYRYFGVRTIDQMAELRDDVCQKIMGATPLKQRAIAFLAMAKDKAPLQAVQAELVKRDEQIESLTKAVEAQAAELKAMRENGGKAKK
jgi:hypothetical protein